MNKFFLVGNNQQVAKYVYVTNGVFDADYTNTPS